MGKAGRTRLPFWFEERVMKVLLTMAVAMAMLFAWSGPLQAGGCSGCGCADTSCCDTNCCDSASCCDTSCCSTSCCETKCCKERFSLLDCLKRIFACKPKCSSCATSCTACESCPRCTACPAQPSCGCSSDGCSATSCAATCDSGELESQWYGPGESEIHVPLPPENQTPTEAGDIPPPPLPPPLLRSAQHGSGEMLPLFYPVSSR